MKWKIKQIQEENMDFGKAFTYVFEDEEWIKKILIGALLSLIPFVGWWFVGGWGLEITKNVIRKVIGNIKR